MSCVGILSDGKPGHVNQSLGLADALVRLRPQLGVQVIPAMSRRSAIAGLVKAPRIRECTDKPKLLIAAGHATHLSLFALRRTYSCPIVVLMRPSFPGAFFDLRIEPRHDGGHESERCWISEGPLNRMQPSASRTQEGLMLLGGPSPHYAWDEGGLVEQIKTLCDGRRQWQLTSSRRTPPSLLSALRDLRAPGLQVHDATNLPSTWLSQTLPGCAECWVTPDSASMVYEALTAGSAVGVFDLPASPGSRVVSAIEGLAAQKKITTFTAYTAGNIPVAPVPPFAEADRIALRIVDRGWL